MFKMSLAVFRRPDLSQQEFLDYWRNIHAPLVLRLAGDIRLVRYVQHHGEDCTLSRQFVWHRGVAGLHDGVAQLWWRSEADRLAAAATDAGAEASRLLREDERRFCDLTRSTVSFGVEHVVFDGRPSND
ncbi:EthD domain-containing protein [uncultured Brevundimonas sp.]|uniref:EthD domain-containing protein n=1 Tax=uncultured Brevundimonas sp. TaxID=213418 RepID=UPI0025CE0685|nr:EthD domain-containing protein [uncultured Brevundimonas sp.]